MPANLMRPSTVILTLCRTEAPEFETVTTRTSCGGSKVAIAGVGGMLSPPFTEGGKGHAFAIADGNDRASYLTVAAKGVGVAANFIIGMMIDAMNDTTLAKRGNQSRKLLWRIEVVHPL